MADGYDRYENEGGGGGSFVMGLLTGTVLGAGLGMLFAPKAGSELRNQLSEQAGSLRGSASEGYRRATDTAGEWADKARDAVSRGADEAQRYARDAASGARDVANSAKDAASSAASTFKRETGSSYGTSGSGYTGGAGSSPTGEPSTPGTGGTHRS